MYAAKRFCCGPGADSREPTKQFYTKLFVYNTVVLGLRYKKQLLPMKKEEAADLESSVVHIANSKTEYGIGDMPLTEAACEALRRQMEETPGSEHFLRPNNFCQK